MFLLKSRRPARFGKWIERMLAPDPDTGLGDEEGRRLGGTLDAIEFDAPAADGNPE